MHELEEILTCKICAVLPISNPTLCIYCEQTMCRDCFLKCIRTSERCPFCRAIVYTSEVANVKILSELADAFLSKKIEP